MHNHITLISNKKSRFRGFTLIEIMVSLAIVGILAAVGMPSFVGMIKKFRINAIRDDLQASIQLAQTDAIRRGLPIILERTTNCGLTPTNADDWSCGWQSVVDSNNNNIADTDERKPGFMRQGSTVPSGYTVSNVGNASQVNVNKWGQVTGVRTFVISNLADGTAGSATQSVCILRGTRVFSKAGSTTCS